MEENFKVGMRKTRDMGQRRRTQKLKTIAVHAKKKKATDFTLKKIVSKYLKGKQSENMYLQQITNVSH